MTNSIDCWQWMRRCSVTEHLQRDTVPPSFVWCELTCQLMEWLTKLEFPERLCFPVLERCIESWIVEDATPDHPTAQQRSHTSDLVFTRCGFFFFFFPFLRGCFFFVVLHTWCLESDAAYFLFCLFWHFLKHDKSQECKRARPVSRGGRAPGQEFTCKVRHFPGKPTLILI